MTKTEFGHLIGTAVRTNVPVVAFILFFAFPILWVPILLPIHVGLLTLALGSTYLIVHQPTSLRRNLVAYASQNALFLCILFLFSSALGGSSMAVSDGSSTFRQRTTVYSAVSLQGLLFMQAVLIPWTWFALRIITKRHPLMKGEA